jgi:hypothetical protein
MRLGTRQDSVNLACKPKSKAASHGLNPQSETGFSTLANLSNDSELPTIRAKSRPSLLTCRFLDRRPHQEGRSGRARCDGSLWILDCAMKATLVLAVLAWAYAAWVPPGSTAALECERSATPRESRVPVGGADLYSREVGQGTAIIVLHGGPDFRAVVRTIIAILTLAPVGG